MNATKEQLLQALSAFISQRSGIDFRNYGERESFMGDYRPMLRSGREARAMLGQVGWRNSITAQDLIAASNRAFSGRLQFVQRADGAVAVDYTTGQYFPTEYRSAACAVLASVLWAYWRESMPVGEGTPDKATPSLTNCGEYIRKTARRELGRGIAARWFN